MASMRIAGVSFSWAIIVAVSLANPLPLKVSGTQVLDSSGKSVLLRGVNAASLEWSSDGEGRILETVRVAIDDWKSNVVRIPLSQDRWFGKAPEQKDDGKAYRALVRKTVDLAAKKNVYAILDLHWNNAGEWGKNIGQHVLPDEGSVLFWKEVARDYKNHPAVIFDLYNEPHDVTWDQWRDGGSVTEKLPRNEGTRTYKAVGMKTLFETVRATGAKNVVVVGGLDWSYDMSGFLNGYALADPKGNGIIYANHAYPFKGDTVEKWMEKMDLASKTLPIIVSEFGSEANGGAGLKGPEWVAKVLAYLKQKNLHWTAWDLHPAAGPRLLSDWDYNPTPGFGVPVLEALTGVKVPTSIIPVEDEAPTKAGDYNWLARHQAVIDYAKSHPVDLILIGDSITHGWGGPPAEGGNRGPGSGLFEKYFGSRNALNMGFGWDATQHVLWRFSHGALDNIKPKAAMIMIGTNNVWSHNSDDIVTGITKIVTILQRKQPQIKILLMGIFPRDDSPTHKNRVLVAEVNAKLAKLKFKNTTYLDLHDRFVNKDGTISREIMPDLLHLTPKGYEIWAKAVDPYIAKMVGDKPRD